MTANDNSIPSPLRILLLEDSEHDAIAFRRALEKGNLAVEITHYLRAEAIQEPFAGFPAAYDLLVADYKLPGITGLEFCRQVMARDLQLPCVILTGAGSEKVAVEALKAGVKDYLVKDYQQSYLEILPLFLIEVVGRYRDCLKARLFRKERDLIAAISEMFLVPTADLDAVFRKLAESLATGFAFPLAVVLLQEDDKFKVKGQYGFSDPALIAPEVIFGETLCWQALAKGEAVFKEDFSASPATLTCPFQKVPIATCLAVPIKNKDDQLLGVIAVADTVKRVDRAIHIQPLQTIANYLGQLLCRKKVEKRQLLQQKRLQALWRITGMQDDDLHSICDAVLEEIVNMTESVYGFYGFFDENAQAVTVHSWSEKVMAECRTEEKLKVYPLAGAGIWGNAIRERKPFIHNHYEQECSHKKGIPAGHVSLTRILSVPVILSDRIVAQAAVANKKGEYNEEDAVQLVSFLTGVQMILERKQKEIQIQEAKDEWQKSFDAISDIVTIQNQELRIVRANQAAVDFFAKEYDEIIGKKCYEIFTGTQEPCPGCPGIAALQEIIDHSAIIENKNLKKTFQVSSAPILNEFNEVKYLVHIAKDISQQKRLEEQVNQAQKMESIGHLAGGIAHDFNNILTVINMHAECAMTELEKGSELWLDLDEIHKAGERAANLTRQLLAFSRKQMIVPRSVNINKVITDLGKMLGRLVSEDIRLETTLDEEVGRIHADPGQLDQIIINLVVNARDAVKKQPDSVAKIIRVTTSQVFLDNDYVACHEGSSPGWHMELQVEDSGCGMSEEVREHIFEPFYTTKGVGQGTGMGLATVYGIVKQNQGSIYAYSTPGKGTTFKIYWPIKTVEDSEVVVETAQPASGGNEVILLAEDNEPLRKIISRQLRQAGYTIIEAENGREALAKARAHQGDIDLLFADVIMPLMGGKELSEKIKAIYPDIALLFASGYTDSEVGKDILNQGNIEHFINKPYSVSDVMVRIRRLLDNSPS